MPDAWLTIFIRIGVAALGGLAVGIEREWSVSRGQHVPHFAGVRTFLLLSVLGALSALLTQAGLALASAALIAAAAALVVTGYLLTSRKGQDVGGTTEVAGLLVLTGGLFAGLGNLTLASGLFALMTLVLIEKGRLHRFVSRIQSAELVAAARFAVLALVVFPLLPAGPLGPAPGIRPQELWALVLVFSGLSFAGFLALRLLGGHRGYYAVGLLGGLVSSTAVTLNFSRESRQQPELGRALALGVVAACGMLPLRTLLLITLLNPPVGQRAALYLLPPALAGMIAAWWLNATHRHPSTGRARTPRNPLRFVVALQMVLAFQAVFYAVEWVQRKFGSTGLLSSSALLGLTDVDALIYSMVRLGGAQTHADIAAKALAVGVLSNTVFKGGIALGIGRRGFRGLAAAGLLAIGTASLAALLLVP